MNQHQTEETRRAVEECNARWVSVLFYGVHIAAALAVLLAIAS